MSESLKILVTCPPMLEMLEAFQPLFDHYGADVTAPDVVQSMSVGELVELMPFHDGWIIGDDPACRQVFEAGRQGNLRAAVKWGIGVDNVDFEACRELAIPIANTPNMFGAEVADVAMGYVIALARETFPVDRGVRAGEWPKPCGISLKGKTAGLIGLGDIGTCAAKRMLASEMQVIAYDPFVDESLPVDGIKHAEWPDEIENADFIIVTSSLTDSSRHMVNASTFAEMKPGVRIINVGRGPVIDENALSDALAYGRVHSAALDVFEREPLPLASELRSHPRCVFGSHNASNTVEAVSRTSKVAIDKLMSMLS